MRSSWWENPRLQSWIIIIRNLRNIKNNLFLTKLVSSIPKYSVDRSIEATNSTINQVLETRGGWGNWHSRASENSHMTLREKAVNKWSRLIVSEGQRHLLLFLSILSLLLLDLRLCTRALFVSELRSHCSPRSALHPEYNAWSFLSAAWFPQSLNRKWRGWELSKFSGSAASAFDLARPGKHCLRPCTPDSSFNSSLGANSNYRGTGLQWGDGCQ